MASKKTTAEIIAESLIDRVKQLEQVNWKEPIINKQRPLNFLSGTHYKGSNNINLRIIQSVKGYEFSSFSTFNQYKAENIRINKGEKSFPIVSFTPQYLDLNSKKIISLEDYRLLSKEEQIKYIYKPNISHYKVFNIEQTDIKTSRPDIYDKLSSYYKNKNEFSIKEIDTMLEKGQWVTPILQQPTPSAYYSPSKDHIVIAPKNSFREDVLFYQVLFHEMSHSTGHHSRLNRPLEGSFGSPSYAKEELIAELSSALLASTYGFDQQVKEQNANYLKSWLQDKDPEEILNIVKEASNVQEFTEKHIQSLNIKTDIKTEEDKSNLLDLYLEPRSNVSLPFSQNSSLPLQKSSVDSTPITEMNNEYISKKFALFRDTIMEENKDMNFPKIHHESLSPISREEISEKTILLPPSPNLENQMKELGLEYSLSDSNKIALKGVSYTTNLINIGQSDEVCDTLKSKEIPYIQNKDNTITIDHSESGVYIDVPKDTIYEAKKEEIFIPRQTDEKLKSDISNREDLSEEEKESLSSGSTIKKGKKYIYADPNTNQIRTLSESNYKRSFDLNKLEGRVLLALLTSGYSEIIRQTIHYRHKVNINNPKGYDHEYKEFSGEKYKTVPTIVSSDEEKLKYISKVGAIGIVDIFGTDFHSKVRNEFLETNNIIGYDKYIDALSRGDTTAAQQANEEITESINNREENSLSYHR